MSGCAVVIEKPLSISPGWFVMLGSQLQICRKLNVICILMFTVRPQLLHFTDILSIFIQFLPTPWSLKWLLYSMFSDKIFFTHLLSNACYMFAYLILIDLNTLLCHYAFLSILFLLNKYNMSIFSKNTICLWKYYKYYSRIMSASKDYIILA